MKTGVQATTLALVGFTTLLPYALLHGLGPLHITLATVLCLAFGFGRTRPMAAVLLPFTVFLFVYDSLRSIAPYVLDRVVVGPFYRAEATLFGLVPAEALLDSTHPAIDLLGGVVYSLHVPVVVLMAVLLLWRGSRDRTAVFAWGFLLLNLIANAVQVAFPVAPPWYVFQHGIDAAAVAGTGDAAGLLRFDAIIGHPHFASIYENAAYVFGAFPSLHVAFPAWVACNARTTFGRVTAGLFTAIMAFFAIYLQHHYVLDVFAGAGLAVLVYAFVSSTTIRPHVIALHARLAGDF